jgi:hypothetical protein
LLFGFVWISGSTSNVGFCNYTTIRFITNGSFLSVLFTILWQVLFSCKFFYVIQYFYLKYIYICNYSSLISSKSCKVFSLRFAPCILICLEIHIIFRRIRKIAKSDYELRHVCPSAWNNSAPDIQIFMNFNTSIIRKSDEKIQVSLKSDKNNRYFAWRPVLVYDCMSISSS